LHAYTSDHFVLPLPQGHRFPMQKYAWLREAVSHLSDIDLREAPAASDGELALAHDPAWVSVVTQGTLDAAQQREIGFPWSPAMVERSRRSVGATVAAARQALFGGSVAGSLGSSVRGSERGSMGTRPAGVACNLAGGTHHAESGKGAGFCVFNDVAVAARLMQAEQFRHNRELLQVLVIDLDVHQGNGTAEIFARDDSVFTLSLHGEHNYPFRKAVSDLDVHLPDGCGDDAYLAALDDALDEVWERLSQRPPGLAFYLAGADAHQGDRLGRLRLSDQGLAWRDQKVFDELRRRRIPVAVSMAGGYAHDLRHMVSLQARTIELARDAWRAWRADQGSI
jgi:acetoin utilization deacetylase AcuC-like enzyme